MRQTKDFVILVLKGIGMGAADVIPGVSGGTIAFISGIYEELISSIKSINFKSLRLLFTGRVSSFIDAVNGWFLLAVFGGVAISIFSLAQLMKWLLTNHPIPVWSFFFGLILISAFYILRSAGRLKISGWGAFVIGVAISLVITTISPATTPESWWFIFIAGAIGICAMILPGISGAFILLLLGKYLFMITAITELNIPIILLFIAGAATGLILFSNLLSWLLKNYNTLTIALLAGFMIGSLNKVWPWKLVKSFVTGSHGEIVPVTERNVFPETYSAETGLESGLALAIILFITGILLLVVIETVGKRVNKR
jgi:putative membrane protein